MNQLPTGWKEFSRSGSDSITFIRPGHTAAAPRLAIFDRKVPTPVSGNTAPVGQYRLRLIDGHVDSEGVPLSQRSIVEINIRQPSGFATTAVGESITAAVAILGGAEFVDDATVDYMFPREAPAA